MAKTNKVNKGTIIFDFVEFYNTRSENERQEIEQAILARMERKNKKVSLRTKIKNWFKRAA